MAPPTKQKNGLEEIFYPFNGKHVFRIFFCFSIIQTIAIVTTSIILIIFVVKSPEFGNAVLKGVEIEQQLNSRLMESTEKLIFMKDNLESFSQNHPQIFNAFEDLVSKIETEFEYGKYRHLNGGITFFDSLLKIPSILNLGNRTLTILNNEIKEERVNGFLDDIVLFFGDIKNVTQLAETIEKKFLENGKIQISF